ncbi:hypothetical protein R8Z50_30335 [Longispora sp. K20-0274]|uniref:hypothetical protein n=1 Tax=Longispora sp. K20-0274 TaxID=3088255 RepID=UPI0039999375
MEPTPAAQFADKLIKVKVAARLSFRQMVERGAKYSKTQLNAATNGETVPQWPLVKEFLTACGVDPGDFARWQRELEVVRRQHERRLVSGEVGDLRYVLQRRVLRRSDPRFDDPVPVLFGAAVDEQVRYSQRWRHAGAEFDHLRPDAPNPSGINTVAELVAALGDVRVWAGRASYRKIQAATGIPSSTVSDMLNNRERLPDETALLRFLGFCGIRHSRVVLWRAAWIRAAESQRPARKPRSPRLPRPRNAGAWS